MRARLDKLVLLRPYCTLIQFLKAKNEVLFARIEGPVRVTARERFRLVRLAKPLGAAVRDLVTIVEPATLRFIPAHGMAEPAS